MNKKWLILIIVILILMVFNVKNPFPFGFHYYKHQHIFSPKQPIENVELLTLKKNFEVNIENSNIRIDELFVKDTLNNILSLSDVFKNGNDKILVCRFSESHCESCVTYSIWSILNQIDATGKDNVVFLGKHRNNRIFNQEKTHYNIQDMSVYNSATLNLPVEALSFPYYFILGSDMTISNVFVPDKATPVITNDYLRMINKRYFSKKGVSVK